MKLKWRRRIAPVAVVFLLVFVGSCLFGMIPPSDGDLRARLHEDRADLEALFLMAKEDELESITQTSVRSARPLPEQRLGAYRALLERTGVLSLARSDAAVQLLVFRAGIAPSGLYVGLARSLDDAPLVSKGHATSHHVDFTLLEGPWYSFRAK